MGITDRQMFFLSFDLIIPFIIPVLPNIMANNFKSGSWVFIVSATLIYSLEAGIIAYLGYLYKNMTIFEYSREIAGKFISYIISILYMFNFFIFFSLLIRSVSEVIKTEIMTNTPLWVTIFVMILASGYAVSKGLTDIGRIVEIVGTFVIIIGLSMNLLMFLDGNALNMRPLLNFYDLSKYIKSFPLSLYLYSGFEIITIIPFTKHNGKKAIRSAMLSIVILGLFYIMITETCFMELGIEDTVNYNYPFITAIRRIDIRILQFLKRIDLIFIVTWLFNVFASSSILLYGTVEFARKIFHKPGSNKIIIVICIISFIVALLPKSDAEVNNIILNYCYYASGIIIFIIPITLLILAKVKRYGKKI